jgi:hypothetical protein
MTTQGGITGYVRDQTRPALEAVGGYAERLPFCVEDRP